MANTVNKRVNIWVNGKEVENNIKSVRDAMAKLKNEQNKMTIGSKEYVAAGKDIQKLDAIYAEHRKGLKSTTDEIDKATNKTKKWLTAAAIVGTGKLIMDGASKIKSSTQEYVDAYAVLDDTLAGVRKTTGMTTEEIDKLNKSLKAIDTRTSTNELMEIAEEGGRLGIAKEDILAFTKAVDVANVALGDSFGGGAEQIATVLGKIRNSYKETNAADIGESFNRIGSVINELGATSAASEENIADFTQRVGSMPDVFKPTIQEAIALGAVFEENGVDAEVASRSYGILMKTAAADIEKFAVAMGEPVDAMREMMNADPAAFALRFAESLKGMSATETAEYLDKLGLNADGVNRALGALSNNTARAREMFTNANTAFSECTSILNEFSIVNNNSAAQLEKHKKKLADTKAEIGKNLLPVYMKLSELTEIMSGKTATLMNWFLNHKNITKLLIGALVTYGAVMVAAKVKTVALNTVTVVSIALKKTYRTVTLLAAAATALFAGNTRGVHAAMLKLSRVFPVVTAAFGKMGTAAKATGGFLKKLVMVVARIAPWAAFVAAIYAGVIALDKYSKKLRDVRDGTKVMRDAYEQASIRINKKVEEEKAVINSLVEAINDNNTSYDDKIAKIKELQALIPGYVAVLGTEGQVLYQNSKAIELHNKGLMLQAEIDKKKAAMDAGEIDYAKFYEESGKAAEEYSEKLHNYLKASVNANGEYNIFEQYWAKIVRSYYYRNDGHAGAAADLQNLEARQNKLYNLNKEINELQDKIAINEVEINQVNEEAKEKAEAEKKRLGEELKATQAEAKRQEQQIEAARKEQEKKDELDRYLAELAEFYDKKRVIQLNDWVQTRDAIEKEYNAFIEKDMKLNEGKEVGILEGKKNEDIIAAGKAFVEKYNKGFTDFAEELAKKNGPANEILNSIFASDKEWDEQIANFTEQSSSLTQIIDDLKIEIGNATGDTKTQLEEQLQIFENSLSRAGDAISAAELQKATERNKIISDFIEKEKNAVETASEEETDIVETESEKRKRLFEKEKQQKISQYQAQIDFIEAIIAAESKVNPNSQRVQELTAIGNKYKELIGIVENSVFVDENTWSNLFNPKESDNYFNDLADGLQQFAYTYLSIYNSIYSAEKALREQELIEFTESCDEKAVALKQQYEDGIISQKKYDAEIEKLEAAKQAKERKLQRDNFKREKTASTIEAVIQGTIAAITSFASLGFPWGLIPMALSIATTTAQVAAISAQPNPYVNGGYITKEQIARMGEQGTEWVASNKLIKDKQTSPMIAALEAYQRGDKKALDMLKPAEPSWKNLSKSAQKISSSFVSSKPNVTKNYYTTDSPEMLAELKTMNSYLSDPRNRQAVISHEIQLENEKNISFIKKASRIS